MTGPSDFLADVLLGKLKEVLRRAPDNVEALCEIGGGFAELGRAQDARKSYRAAVDALRRAARAGDVNRALECESLIYRTFVRTTEDEPRPRDGKRPIEPKIYVFAEFDPVFPARCREIGVEVVLVSVAMGAHQPPTRLQRLVWLRERFRTDRIGVCVWVSLPNMAAFAFSMRLAPVQIFWSMRFHPVSGPYIDGYITWGASSETTRRYGNQEWQVVPMPLALDDAPPPRTEMDQLRGRFPETVLLGTLAREEKINSVPYLQAVTEILAANPQTGFLWTGRKEHPGIAGFFRAAGVGDRCHFVGWVDTRLYAAALDVFLESFPSGSGVTSLQALAAGTPLLSCLHPQTIFGTYYWDLLSRNAGGFEAERPALGAPDEYPILCARDTQEYVALAGRLISDAEWRAEVGARGRVFFEEELRNNDAYASRFFETVSRIAVVKLGLPIQKNPLT